MSNTASHQYEPRTLSGSVLRARGSGARGGGSHAEATSGNSGSLLANIVGADVLGAGGLGTNSSGVGTATPKKPSSYCSSYRKPPVC